MTHGLLVRAGEVGRSVEGRLIRAGVLIWVDWIAGAVAGVLVLALRGWLTDLYALPGGLLLVMGLANLAYAGVSLTLALRSRGDRVPLLRVVAVANITWALLCAAWAVVWYGEASALGMGQLVAEAVFVGGLGIFEWRAAGRVPPDLESGVVPVHNRTPLERPDR